MKHILFLLLTVTFLFSCTNTKDNPPRKIVDGSEKGAEEYKALGLKKEAAEEYARIGEILIVAEGLIYADKMFDKALELDSANSRANFYSAFLKPTLKLQGFTKR